MTDETSWHALPVEGALEQLASSPAGLSSPEASERLSRHGPNQLIAAPPVAAFSLLLDEFRNPLVIVLFVAAAVLVAVGVLADEPDELLNAGLIGLIVLLNAALGFTQNYRAQRGIESLGRLAAPSAVVLRDGAPERIDAALVVDGDVVLLEEGERVPADGRLLEAIELRVDESALTVESVAVRKGTAVAPTEAALADRLCMAYSGTVVMRGRAA